MGRSAIVTVLAQGCILLAILAAGCGCDTVAPVDETQLVVEGFLNSGRPLEAVTLRRTLSPNRAYDADEAAVDDALVTVYLGGASIRYGSSGGRPGEYLPDQADGVVPRAGERFSFRAGWRDRVVQASGVVPPQIEIVEASVSIPEGPVSAVLLDSLGLVGFSSIGAYTGYIYVIDVTIAWEMGSVPGWSPEDSWIRAQLKPYTAFSSVVVDLFLRPDEIFAEQGASEGRRTWKGVYAVSVASPDDPLPEHDLRVALLRSGESYARFAASRGAPERREPISAVSGGIGVFAAVAVDSLLLRVDSSGGWVVSGGQPES